jgi:hypothetical protein
VFQYTIQAGETDADGISIEANTLALNSGTISDAAGNNATLTHSAVSANTSYKVDTTAPTVSSVAITSATGIQNSLLNAGDVVSVTATFSENVTVTGTPQLTLVVGGTNRTATYTSGSGSTPLVFQYTIQAGETDADGISIEANTLALNSGTISDAAGNNATLTHSAVSANTSYKVDTTAPTLAESTLVPSFTNDNSTQYTFSSSEGGTISVGGSCSSDNNTAVADNMTVSFAALADGTYSDCTITVTDSSGNTQTISVNTFTIDTVKPVLAQVIAVTTPTNDNTSSYTLSSTEAGNITYGVCSGSPNNASADNNTIIFDALADGTYSDCKISVTDNASNTSDNLSVSPFTIDTVKPVLAQVTAVTNPINTPIYIFSSNEAGTITYGGSCGSSTTSATSGNNTVILTQPDNSTALSEAQYVDCSIKVTDNATNQSDTLSVGSFTIDTTAPTVDNVSSSSFDGDYYPGDNITITVSFNDNVIVENSSGNPRIQLETGSNDRYANYVSGNSSSTLSFLYTVQSGDNFSDLDYKATDSLSANSGTIRDNATNDANLTLASPGATNSLGSNKTLVFWTDGWKQEAYIKSINRPNTNMMFGSDVDISDDTIAVGAYFERSRQRTITNGATAASDSTAYNGAVYVYTRDNTSWSQQAYIKPSNAQQTNAFFTYFGFTISLDNNTLAVGAQADPSSQRTITNSSDDASTDGSRVGSGAVFVYTRSGTEWSQQAYIKASNNFQNSTDDQLGRSVALSGDTIVASANNEDTGDYYSNNNTGAAYVFTRSGTAWSEQTILRASNSDVEDKFGHKVDIDNNTLVVSSIMEDSNQATITNGTSSSSNNDNEMSGAVYVYTRSGTTWSQQAYIKASNNDGADFFGNSLSLSGDTLAVSATAEDSNQTSITNGSTSSSDNSANGAGAVYIYTRSGTDWSQQAYIKPSNAIADMNFGTSVSLQGDLLVVGSQSEKSSSTTIINSNIASSDISKSGSGATYVFKRSGTSWSQIAYIKAVNSRTEEYFGTETALDNSTIVVATTFEKSNQQGITNGTSASSDSSNENGAAYVYRFY